uniref:Uncharacterized protein n=1 Tax=Sclerotinia borealis TaxID=77105 RepID=A0A088CAK7_9HELO|nr:hypothetical protein SBORM_0100 [Sclerotinia borealis]AHX83044.1 hypothetical protein SBORM_0100 [Sclerotinia borealis]
MTPMGSIHHNQVTWIRSEIFVPFISRLFSYTNSHRYNFSNALQPWHIRSL